MHCFSSPPSLVGLVGAASFQPEDDRVAICSDASLVLMRCMKEHSDYYGPLISKDPESEKSSNGDGKGGEKDDGTGTGSAGVQKESQP